jgi:hypothetical protein
MRISSGAKRNLRHFRRVRNNHCFNGKETNVGWDAAPGVFGFGFGLSAIKR